MAHIFRDETGEKNREQCRLPQRGQAGSKKQENRNDFLSKSCRFSNHCKEENLNAHICHFKRALTASSLSLYLYNFAGKNLWNGKEKSFSLFAYVSCRGKKGEPEEKRNCIIIIIHIDPE